MDLPLGGKYEAVFWERTKKTPDGCLEWTGRKHKDGYGEFDVVPLGAKRNTTVLTHRQAWVFANKKQIPDGLYVRHTCDNPPCVNPEHLLLGTQADNMNDMYGRGRRSQAGECAGNHVLTWEIVRHMRRTYTGKRGQKAAWAREYGVSKTNIGHIISGKIWQEPREEGDLKCLWSKSSETCIQPNLPQRI